jgi:hypothetical protein
MPGQMNFLSAVLILVSLVAVQGVAPKLDLSQATATPTRAAKLNGRWRVKFILSGVEKNLIFDAKAKGSGFFLLLDTEPDDKPVATPLPAAWSQLTSDRVSFSGEVELPVGTCCRELGTLMLKGKFNSNNSITGRAVFVTSTVEEENIIGFRSTVGTFIATRIPK